MNQFKPMLLSDMKGYSRAAFTADLIAGIIVAIIALPLSVALAIASGVRPEAGLYTAIFAGFLAACFGGSSVQISGPTAAFATIVAGIVAQNGTEGLALATILAGILLILFSVCRLGNLIKFIPDTITTGFTAGIAVTLVIGQLKDFFGISYVGGQAPIETMEKLTAFFENIATVNIEAIVVGVISLAILFLWPKKLSKIPASLVAVAVGILLVSLLGLSANTIGTLYTIDSAFPAFRLPAFSGANILSALPNAFTIALLAGIESLLSCVVADDMVGKKHRPAAELLGQGLGNIGSALFGGIPATGAIARTAANVKNGGRTPIAAIVHALVLLGVLLVLMPYAAYIPMPTIAAILIHVAYNMCGAKRFISLAKTERWHAVIVLFATFLLTVIFDLVVAIAVGIVLAFLLPLFSRKRA